MILDCLGGFFVSSVRDRSEKKMTEVMSSEELNVHIRNLPVAGTERGCAREPKHARSF